MSKNHFIALANQDLAKDKNRTDLVGYDYDERQSISIEIESVSEADSHPQQVVKNMLKWEELHLDRCEIWSFNKKIFQIYDDLMEMEQEKKKHGEKNRVDTLNKVTIHVLNRMNNASSKQGTKSNTENEPGNGSENEAGKEAEGENESRSEAGSETELLESGNENESESDGGLEKELKKEKSEKGLENENKPVENQSIDEFVDSQKTKTDQPGQPAETSQSSESNSDPMHE